MRAKQPPNVPVEASKPATKPERLQASRSAATELERITGMPGQHSNSSRLFVGASARDRYAAAEAVARELNLELMRVDLSTVIGKYVGETEKNLASVFAAAEQANAVLLLDEADALFGKRSGVKDSHDRHANTEANYLLQRMETYPGVVILATGKANIDAAFLRRFKHVVELPMPEPDQPAR